MPKLAALIASTAVLLAPSASANERTSGETRAQALDSAVLLRVNAIRKAHHLVALKQNAVLTAAATTHSLEMLADGYFAHDSADGTPFWRRLRRYTNGAQTGYWSVGENLLWSTPDAGAAKALALWMASPDHKRNILTARWRDIGIGAVHVDDAPGAYGDRPVTVITTDFGVRR